MENYKRYDIQYKELIENILENGTKKADRTGVGTVSIFCPPQIRIDLSKEFPLHTLRKMHLKSVIHEMLWFLSSYDEQYEKFGNTNIRYLLDNKVTFWTEWPYENYKKGYLKEYQTNDLLTEKRLKKFKMLSMKDFEEKIKSDDEFALKWGDLGPVYGKQWLDFGGYKEIIENTKEYNYGRATKIVDHHGWNDAHFPGVNQINNIIDQLLDSPDSRRILISAWNPMDTDDMLLPPCHLLQHYYTTELTQNERLNWILNNRINIEEFGANVDGMTTEEYRHMNKVSGKELEAQRAEELKNAPTRKLSLMLYIRSNDMGLGNPYNVAEYCLLIHMIAQVCNMVPGEFILNIGDAHIYTNHVDVMKEILTRDPLPSSKLILDPTIKNIYEFRENHFLLKDYQAHPNIKMNVAV